MAMTMGRGDGQAYCDINMTPLIDVMLVLLIIFIITIPSQTHSIIIDNPLAAARTIKPEIIDLTVDFDGTVFWNGQYLGHATLQARIRREAAADPQPEIHIRVDKFAKYAVVAQ